MNDLISSTFCALPFSHMKVGVDGKLSPCCRFPTISQKYDFAKLDIENKEIDNLFNSENYLDIRNRMLKGERVSGCEQCYADEKAGAKSLRQTSNMQFEDKIESMMNKPKIYSLEVAVGNTCNLKCIMCGVSYSYKWLEDEKKLISEFNFSNSRREIQGPMHVDKELLFNKESLHELRHVKIVGGEPLGQPKMIKFLESLVEMNIANKIVIEIYTNMTHFPSDHAIKILGNFKEVQLLFSIDGIGSRVEYIRFPSSWEDIERNALRWLEVPKKYPCIYLSCNYTINIMNVYYYEEIANWWHELTKLTKFEKHLETTFVNYPSYLSVSILPKEMKKLLIVKLEKFRNSHPDQKYIKYNVKRIISRLGIESSGKIEDFYSYINNMDKIRGTSFKKTFPELSDLLMRS